MSESVVSKCPGCGNNPVLVMTGGGVEFVCTDVSAAMCLGAEDIPHANEAVAAQAWEDRVTVVLSPSGTGGGW